MGSQVEVSGSASYPPCAAWLPTRSPASFSVPREKGGIVPQIVFGIFLILHGLVHLLYFGQSARFFNLTPNMVWPDGSWAFSKLLGERGTRTLARALCILAAVGFVSGGLGVLFGQTWWRWMVASSAVLSAGLYILLWNGRLEHLDAQGGIGILIDAAILVAAVVFSWPKLDF